MRLYHLEGLSYQEISATVGIPENSVGPTLTRAREKVATCGGIVSVAVADKAAECCGRP